MKDRKLMLTGGIGTVVFSLACFSPALVVLLGFAGLSAWLGWLDWVLFPALGLFIAITAYALYRRFHSRPRAVSATE